VILLYQDYKYTNDEDASSMDTLVREETGPLDKAPPKTKKILVVDDDRDLTTTFKTCLEAINELTIAFHVYTYNNPLLALSDFKSNFYDLLLVDINMPLMNGFELSERILKLDINVKICFMSAGEINQEAIREVHSMKSIGCYIKKPVEVEDLVERLKGELA
jgi:CheY-like chemotaxis protein